MKIKRGRDVYYNVISSSLTGCMWLGIGTNNVILWARWCTFGFHKMRAISWLADELLVSQELWSLKLGRQ